MAFNKVLSIGNMSDCPDNFESLSVFIQKRLTTYPGPREFRALAQVVSRYEGFFEDLLPAIWKLAKDTASEISTIPMLDTPAEIRLSRKLCAGIIAHAFLCGFDERPSNDCLSGKGLPSINFDELLNGSGNVELSKIMMILAYFEKMSRRLTNNQHLGRISFSRSKATDILSTDWVNCKTPLLLPTIMPVGTSIDDSSCSLRVDFANKIIGGAAISFGCAQEEIMFCAYPEMIVARLLCPAMGDGEAIRFRGVEKFSKPEGYGFDLSYGGPYLDNTPTDNEGFLESWVVAIDAMNFRTTFNHLNAKQHSESGILRELGKAWAGFNWPESPGSIATGKWGCGEFGGDPELKCLVQWLAASRARKTMIYHPWSSDGGFSNAFLQIASKWVSAKASVGRLAKLLLNEASPRMVFNRVDGENFP